MFLGSQNNKTKNGGLKGELPSVEQKTSMNTGKIVGYTILGAAVAGGVGLLSSLFDFKQKPIELETIKAKYIPKYDQGICQVFKKMETEVSNFLHPSQRPFYLELLAGAMRNAESILLLEQLASKYDDVPTKYTSKAFVHYKYVTGYLNKIATMFNGLRLKTVQEYIEYLRDSLQEHLQNFDNMGFDYYFESNK